MNWLLIIVLIIIIGTAIKGWSRGFVRELCMLSATIIAIILSALFTPAVSEYIEEQTTIYVQIKDKCVENSFLSSGQDWVDEILDNTGVYEKVGEQIAHIIVKIISYIILFLIISLAIRIIFHIIDFISKAPLLNGFNHLAGAGLGIVKGFLKVWILLLMISVFSYTDIGGVLISKIEENSFLMILYQYNLVRTVILALL